MCSVILLWLVMMIFFSMGMGFVGLGNDEYGLVEFYWLVVFD